MDKIDSFSVLPEAEYEMAKMLYRTGKSLDCKMTCKTRALKNQPKGWRIIFNKRETNSTLFWMQITDGALYVKANLFHIQNYSDKMSGCAKKIKDAIKATKECESCGLCPPRSPYRIDDGIYNPCVFHGHYFTKLENDEWRMLSELIALEHDNQFMSEDAPPAISPDRQKQDKPYHGFHKN